MTIRSDSFSKRLLSLIKKAGDNNKSFAQAIEISENSATNYLKKGRIPEPDILVRIAKRYKKSIDWLLQDLFDEVPKEEISHEAYPCLVLIEHFQQRMIASDINFDLLKLEKIRPEALQEVSEFIKFKIGMYDRRVNGERREEDIPDLIPEEDRRSGQDRRVANLKS